MLMAGLMNQPLGGSDDMSGMAMRSVGVGQMIPFPGKLGLQRRIAEHQLAAAQAEAEAEATRRSVVQQVKEAAIELSLKHLAQDLPKLWGEEGSIRLTHRLSDTWEGVRGYLQRTPQFDSDSDLIPYVDGVLKDFLEFDPDGTVFRYPGDRKGNLHLQDARIINVHVLGEVMTKVQEAFKHWDRIASAIAESNRAP